MSVYRYAIPVLMGTLLYVGLALAQGNPGEIPKVIDGWESLVKSAPWLGLSILTIKWFMNYIENREKAHDEALARKDADFLTLVKEGRAETLTYGEKILTVMDRALETIDKISNKN